MGLQETDKRVVPIRKDVLKRWVNGQNPLPSALKTVPAGSRIRIGKDDYVIQPDGSCKRA